jgi:nucleoside-diphosphate-sugar epimerase
MKIIVTGGLGFIGHRVVKLLEDQGHTCYIIDNESKHVSKLLINERKTLLNSQSYKIDIRSSFELTALFHKIKPDLVINLASPPNQKIVQQNPAYAAETIITGLINLAEICLENDVKKIVHISSSMVYGNFNHKVFENSICNPIGPYGILKLASENLLKDYAKRGLNYTIIRPSAVYGELDSEDRVVAKFLTSALRNEPFEISGGNEVLDFTHVSDVARGITQAALLDSANNNVYNMTCSKEPHTLRELADLIIRIVGQGSYTVADKAINFPSRYLLNINNAQKDFNYESKLTVEQGVKQYYDWYIQNPTLWRK